MKLAESITRRDDERRMKSWRCMHAEEKEGAGRGTSFHADQYGQSCNDILEPRTVERGRGAVVQVLKTSLRVLGEDRPSTLTSMVNLAHTYKTQDRTHETIELIKKIIELRLKIIKTNHSYVTIFIIFANHK